jgi:hypothetical protein
MRFKVMFAGCLMFVLAACAARAGVSVQSVPVEVESETDIDLAEARLYESREKVWICHRGRWRDISGAAAPAHMRHGDRVSEVARERQSGC